LIIILIGADEEVAQPGRALPYQFMIVFESNNEVEVTASKPAQVSIG
jgi:hypothetical protein